MSSKSSSTRRVRASSTISGQVVAINSPTGGVSVAGNRITPTTAVSLGVVTSGQSAAASVVSASSAPTVTSIIVTDSSFNNLDDTAFTPTGGYAKIIGTNFKTGASAYINGASLSTTFISATELRVVVPADAVGAYSLMVFNSDGAGAIYLSLGISNLPTFTTTEGTLGTFYETAAINASVNATGETPIVFSLHSGALPTGATLSSNGTITGTSPIDNSSTVYSFVIKATDPQNQDSYRAFSITVSSDVVTWNTPVASSIDLGSSAMSPVILSATAASGNSVAYSADVLPAGVALSTDTISGTATTEGTTVTTFTAVSASTNRSATKTVTWTVSLRDPQFKYVSLLLVENTATSAVGNNIFIDQVSSANIITRTGNPTQGTFSPYSQTGWSNYFDGTGDYLSLPTNANLQLGSNDFTFEGWINFADSSTDRTFMYWNANASGYAAVHVRKISGKWALWISTSGSAWAVQQSALGSTIVESDWYHVAVVRIGTNVKLYINGSDVTAGGYAVSGSLMTTYTLNQVGAYNTSSYLMTGYISNLRVVNGTGIYTTNFTPSTTLLTSVANTQLLTCQNNRFLDNSSNAFTITVNGNPSVLSFSPFSPGTAYSPSLHGGSMYVSNATANYLTVANADLWNTGTTTPPFTVEAWVYPMGTTGGCIISGMYANSKVPFVIGIGNAAGVTATNNQVWFGYYSGGWNGVISPAQLTMNQWTHVAGVYDGTNRYLYINGVKVATAAAAWPAFSNITTAGYIGKRWDGTGGGSDGFNGYISDVRITKGTAVYTAATITVPTSPLTTSGNTSLLLNMTNAGIIDAHASEVLDVANGVVLSSAVTKYATKSVYFPGTASNALQFPATSKALELSSGDFTVEAWINFSNNNGTYNPVIRYDAINNFGFGYDWSTTQLKYDGSVAKIAAIWTPQLNTWYHVAVTRSAKTSKVFIDGIQVGSTYLNDTQVYPAGAFKIGGSNYSSAHVFKGYMENLRITKGIARYTENFTPPSTKLKTS